jgi:hypothetical protein
MTPDRSASRKQSAQAFSTDENKPIHSSAVSAHSSRSSEAKLFGIEFSDLHVSKEDTVKPRVINSTPNSSKRNTSLQSPNLAARKKAFADAGPNGASEEAACALF